MPDADYDGSVALKTLADLAMRLSNEERAGLALQLLESLDAIPLNEIEGRWQDEVLAKAHALLK